jgi:chromate transporter
MPSLSLGNAPSSNEIDGPQQMHRRGAKPSSWRLLWVWLGLGLQSFGGGAATLYLIRRAVVEQHRWLSDEEFAHYYAISQLAPGINILALTILIGRRCGGIFGIALALGGMLLPSVTITIALTAVYTQIRHLPMVQAALRGVIPATVGLGVMMSWHMGRPLMMQSRREGWTTLTVSSSLLVGSAAVALLIRPPVVLILVTAGILGGLARVVMERKQ